MKNITRKDTCMTELSIINSDHIKDCRGYFTEIFQSEDFKSVGIDFDIKQINESKSIKGTFRGLHIQHKWEHGKALGKVIRVTDGTIIDFALDIRDGSDTFGKIFAYKLEPKNYVEWIYIPPGFAHGFYAVTECKIEYLCDSYWHRPAEESISIWSKSIDWSDVDKEYTDVVNLAETLSQKDKNARELTQAEVANKKLNLS